MSRIELILKAMLTGDVSALKPPKSRIEELLIQILEGGGGGGDPTIPGRVTQLEENVSDLSDVVNTKADGYVVQHVTDFLDYMEVSDIDYAYAVDYLVNRFNPDLIAGGCSVARNGDFVGRNYDLKYDTHGSVVVNRRPTNGFYASVGTATAAIADEPRILPFVLSDGINEKGLFAEINILNKEDRKSVTNGTLPGELDTPIFMLVRRILDECASVAEVKTKLQNDWNVFVPDAGEFGTEYHLFVCDVSGATTVIEFVNNASVFIDQFVDDLELMTNYYLTGYDGTHATLDEHACGVERADIIAAGLEAAATEEAMRALMQSVYYTKTYDVDTNPFWYSEYFSNTSEFGDLNKDSPPEDFADIVAYFRELYENRTRDGQTWITVHSCVYNLADKSFTIRVQETEDEYWFGIEPLGEKPEQIAIDNVITASSTGVPTSAAVVAYISSLGTVEGGSY